MSEESFITSVERIIPNPPFTINIQTNNRKSVRDENSFSEISAESLKDYTWKEHENISTFEISLQKSELGFIGSVIIAILESKKKPVSKVSLNSREVEVEGRTFSLEKELGLFDNSIKETSKTLTINDEGEITEDNNTSHFAKSKSRISFHGIEIPATIFPDSWIRKANQVSVVWPFPMLLVLDVVGDRDLDLNSSRTEIILNEKWASLEEELSFQICGSLSQTVSKNYWKQLREIIATNSSNENFQRGLIRLDNYLTQSK